MDTLQKMLNKNNFYKKLNKVQKENYERMYVWYIKLLYKYLAKKVDLNFIEDLFAKKKLHPIDKCKKDLFHYFSPYTFIYVRNIFNIENLKKIDFEYLYNITQNKKEDIDFIERTIKEVLYDNNLNADYYFAGPINEKYKIRNGSLVIGTRCDTIKLFKDGMDIGTFKIEIFKIMEVIKVLFSNVNLEVEVLNYNDFNAER